MLLASLRRLGQPQRMEDQAGFDGAHYEAPGPRFIGRPERWATACTLALASAACSGGGPSASPPSSQGGAVHGTHAGAAGSGGSGVGGASTPLGGEGGSTACLVELPAPVMVDPDSDASRFRIEGDPPGSDIGTFDPSIVSAADGSLAMSYTSVDLARRRLHTRIAVSSDGGKSFSFAALANAAEEGLVIEVADDADCPDGTCADTTLVHEVSALVEDPEDPDPSRRWKLFTHSYVVLAPDPKDPNTPRLRYQYGQLRMGTAPAAAGPWSPPAPLIGWPSTAPLSLQAPLLTTAFSGLEDCIALTEPSAALDPATDALELAVGCVAPAGAQQAIRIELLRSLDHGASWSHAGRLLEAADAPCVGGEGLQLNAAHLFESRGKRYLIASPAGAVSLPDGNTGSGYRGCLVFARKGDGVERDSQGAPLVIARIDPGERVFAGACAHHPAGGYVLSALSFAAPPDIFRMFGPVGASP